MKASYILALFAIFAVSTTSAAPWKHKEEHSSGDKIAIAGGSNNKGDEKGILNGLGIDILSSKSQTSNINQVIN
ncbi:hypothetical protein VTP01DRAFT_8798 [Rhizomucor pusillus]|uniref:uncharacterized protein n=1 Tax=Rhizomucor pusillus TaxID=4840 RepID=UPI00374480B5